VRAYLRAFEFKKLFVEELGWDRLNSAPIRVLVNERPVSVTPVAEKRGMAIFLCEPDGKGSIPDRQARRLIENSLASAAHEHVTIFADSQPPRQVWQWVRRTSGEPIAYRETWFLPGAKGEALVQKVLSIEFQIAEEPDLTLTKVERRVRSTFDLERVTKRFYDVFKDEREAFLKSVKGLRTDEDQAWYASVMINRLMFVYFIQKKRFLDGNPDYLRNRLETCRTAWGKDKFHTFYRHFLLRLFHEGLGRVERSEELDQLLGRVPYLNGGLFEIHALEERNANIQIADEAFERIFSFFDKYQWHLDDRPLTNDYEINPDVLGYIFEKYINQKELGAYYTGRDITDYIGRSTLVPFLLGRLEVVHRDALWGTGGIWESLHSRPERYFFPEGSYGISEPYPAEVSKGLADPDDRAVWNSSAPPAVALGGETWRDVVYRRIHYEGFLSDAASRRLTSPSATVQWNIDLSRLLLDHIEESEDPRSIAAILRLVQGLTILDPTCGSGAFLFSALNIIQDLYESCLSRIEGFIAEEEVEQGSIDPASLHFFKSELARIADHPNRGYYILKSSIVSNLYGVDIMEEAAEICKLRLFLKIVAQVERLEDLEALPDIDFNIRAGNTLVGYTKLEEVRKSLRTSRKGQARLVTEEDELALSRIEDKARLAEESFSHFRDIQTRKGAEHAEISGAKRDLERTLGPLESELSRTLAADYGVDTSDEAALGQWVDRYHPFHWLVDFYGIMAKGGFDIIVGNPPYLEAREVVYKPRGFVTLESGAIHAMCIERALHLLNERGTMSMIVPLSLVSTQRMTCVQRILEAQHSTFYANFSWRPGKLFDGVNRALTIFVAMPTPDPRTYATNYRKWISDNRSLLMHQIAYTEVPRAREAFWVPKLGSPLERPLLERLMVPNRTLGRFKAKGKAGIFYRTTGGLYWKVFTDFAPGFKLNGKPGHSTRETTYPMRNPALVVPAVALLSSDLFWWWYTVTSNCRDLNPSDLDEFPVPDGVLTDKRLAALGREYLDDIASHSNWLTRVQQQTGTTQTQSFKIQISKGIIDKIDRRLATLYGLSNEELDFIRNYDIKFRMSDTEAEGVN
jgi:hypothetical protein